MVSFPASTCRGGRKYVQGWLQVLAGKVACVWRMQCTASETGKRDTEIVSPIQDKRKGKKTVAFLTAKFTSKNVM